MLADDRVVGVIVLWRTEVEPFDDRTIGVVATFAAQGAIAIQNVAAHPRAAGAQRELSRSVDELRALGEVSQAVSSSLDLDEVLTTIVTRAVELSRHRRRLDLRARAGDREFMLRTCFGTSEELIEALHAHPDPAATRPSSAAPPSRARCARRRTWTPSRRTRTSPSCVRHGWRSMVARSAAARGRDRRRARGPPQAPGALPADTVELLETLASQSAVAIHNARVFRELERKTRELEVASRHKSEFLASMSHELRTPLNAVIGFSDVLLDRMFGELNERQEEYVRDIRDSGRHLLELINEILDLSKIEAGRMELELAPSSLADLLEQRHRDGPRARRPPRHLARARRRARRSARSTADELKLKQVVLNLLTNAVKFTPDGGLGDRRRPRRVGDEAQVERPRHRHRRAGRSASGSSRRSSAATAAPATSTEGTGLGLTLSRRIVDLHGGRLWMESPPDGGSTFSFALPRPAAGDDRAGTSAGPAGGRAEVERARHRGRPPLRRPAAGLSRGRRLHRDRHRDGVEGLELARRLAPAAVILDLLLPRLNGWEVLAQLKGDPATAEIPVVIVSMLDEQRRRVRARRRGVPRQARRPRRACSTRWPAAPRRGATAARSSRSTTTRVASPSLDAALAPAGWSVLRPPAAKRGSELVRRVRPDIVAARSADARASTGSPSSSSCAPIPRSPRSRSSS